MSWKPSTAHSVVDATATLTAFDFLFLFHAGFREMSQFQMPTKIPWLSYYSTADGAWCRLLGLWSGFWLWKWSNCEFWDDHGGGSRRHSLFGSLTFGDFVVAVVVVVPVCVTICSPFSFVVVVVIPWVWSWVRLSSIRATLTAKTQSIDRSIHTATDWHDAVSTYHWHWVSWSGVFAFWSATIG